MILRVRHALLLAFGLSFAAACDPQDGGGEGECTTNPTPAAPVSVETTIVSYHGSCTLSSSTEEAGRRTDAFDCPDGSQEVKWLDVVGAAELMPIVEVGTNYTLDVERDPDFAQLDVLISDEQGALLGVVDNREQVGWGGMTLRYATACELVDPDIGVDGFVRVEHGGSTSDVLVGTPAQISEGELDWDVHAIRAYAESNGEGPIIHAVLLRR